MTAMVTAYISAGSNSGDSAALLARAVALLAEPFVPARYSAGEGCGVDPSQGAVALEVTAVSSVYRTEPQLVKEQPFFLNQVIRIACPEECTAHALLNRLFQVESCLGRVRTADRFGPRTLDLDLLLYGSAVIDNASLIVPHPRMAERAFVLVPLAEIASDLVLPGGAAVTTLLRALSFRQVGDTLYQ